MIDLPDVAKVASKSRGRPLEGGIDERTVGGRVRALRIKHAKTQAQVAEALGRSPSSVTRYESGAYQVSPGQADQLAKLFGVPAAYILFGEETSTGMVGVAEPGPPTFIPMLSDQEAPIVGRVGAGAKIEALVDADPETVTVPHWLQGAIAFRVVGDSCVPVFEHGDLVLVHSEGTGGPGDFLNRFCIVETDGLGYLKRIRPGTAGRYDLESPNADTLYGREISRPRPVVMRIIQGGR